MLDVYSGSFSGWCISYIFTFPMYFTPILFLSTFFYVESYSFKLCYLFSTLPETNILSITKQSTVQISLDRSKVIGQPTAGFGLVCSLSGQD